LQLFSKQKDQLEGHPKKRRLKVWYIHFSKRPNKVIFYHYKQILADILKKEKCTSWKTMETLYQKRKGRKAWPGQTVSLHNR